MKRSAFGICVCSMLLTGRLAVGEEAMESSPGNAAALRRIAVEESLVPIRPGIPGERPFWNGNATQFVYVPSFDMRPVEGATCYRFTAVSGVDGKKLVFEAAEPWATLDPIWAALPVGDVTLTVEGLAETGGKAVGLAGTREFLRAWVFAGRNTEPVMEYGASARLALDKLMHRDYVQAWREGVAVNQNRYWGWRYPAKIVGALISACSMYADLSPRPEDADDALLIARNAAEYLMSISMPAGAPTEYFPPTYRGVKSKGHMDDSRLMLRCPAWAGASYLDLYESCGDKAYLGAAQRIAETYRNTQLPCGTWYQLIDAETGEPVVDNLLIPSVVIQLFDRLIDDHGLAEYQEANDRAIRWILDNPVKTFDWAGQYEDQKPRGPYENQTHIAATRFATRLLNREGDDPEKVALAEELMRFMEDQFIVWGTTEDVRAKILRAEQGNWLAPAGLEQYTCYAPITPHSALMIDAFLAAHRATGKDIYLEKAKALADAITVGQQHWEGSYPSWFRTSAKNAWLNCEVIVVQSMTALSEYCRREDAR